MNNKQGVVVQKKDTLLVQSDGGLSPSDSNIVNELRKRNPYPFINSYYLQWNGWNECCDCAEKLLKEEK